MPHLVRLTVLGVALFIPAARGANQPQVAFKQFPGDRQAIVLLDQTGGGKVELTRGKPRPSEFGAFSWSPDGKRLAYASQGVAGGDLYAIDVAGSGASTRLTRDGNNDQPGWSPTGDRIAYVHTVRVRNANGTFDLHEDIWTVGATGTGQRRLTTDEGEKGPPSWSPDGSKLLFWRLSPSPVLKSELLVVDARSGAALLRTDDDAGAWSPDGKRIAVQTAGGLDVINADGSGRHMIAAGGADPSWSSDGTKIAFDRTHCTRGAKGLCGSILASVFTVGVDGAGQRRLTGPIGGGRGSRIEGFPDDDSREPSWWPDGSRLFFKSWDGARVMNADGTCENQFGPGNLDLGDPAWRPGVRPALPQLTCADLRVRASARWTVPRGRTVRVYVTVENDGNEPATGVKLTLRLTYGRAHVQRPLRSCRDRARLACDLGQLDAGRARHLLVRVTNPQPRAFHLIMHVTAQQPDSERGNNTAVALVAVR